MTDILQAILQSQGGNATQNLAERFGISDSQAGSAVSALLPALLGGLKNNIGEQSGFESLLGALAGGGHQRYVEDPETIFSQETVRDGNGILGHLLGSKDVSRQVANQAAARTGIGTDVLKQMLPVVATMLMGALSKQTQGGNPAAVSSLGGQEGLLGLVTPFLDQNNDGSIADDVFRMIGGFLKR
jgi:hypothetical protein